jgi:MFS family permease
MSPLIKTIVALNLVSGFAQLVQFGLLYPAVSLWLDARGVAAWQVGLVGSFFWVGMLMGNLLTPRWVHARGAGFIVALGCVLSALAAFAGAWFESTQIVLWCGLNALIGLGTGMRWIGNESWLYSITPGEQRGRVVGVHETLIGAGQALGAVLIAAVGVSTVSALNISASICILIPLLLLFAVTRAPAENTIPPSALQVLKAIGVHARSSSGVQIGLLSGLCDGVLYGMLVIYLVKSGESPSTAALMLTAFGIGGLIASVPCGVVSDKYGIRIAAFASCLLGLAGAALLLTNSHAMNWLACVLLGALTGNLLTLAIIAVTEQAAAQGSHMTVAISEVSIAFTVGTIAGPVLAGAAMDAFGLWTLPAITIVLCALAPLMRLPKRTERTKQKTASTTSTA